MSGINRSRLWFYCLAFVGWTASAPAAERPIHYSRDIRPILSNNCFKCHGPDAQERKAGLRLDSREEAFRPTDSGAVVIVPGKSAESELARRITADAPEMTMPPVDSGKKLSAAEKQLLVRWIDEGAEWQQHWSFVPAARAEPPTVQQAAWPRNEIDRFILARLESEGLAPSREAERTTLIRRLTLDLTGLPPTPAEIDAFLADDTPQAYETVVDRLLDSPRYGERMALEWLDAARYADTHGYHIDSGRDMSRWREWVIDAYNRNLPFDRFTIEQLAGDLLPEATLEQQIASGFNRNHMINFEGGAIPDEYHTAYIVDRVNTTGTVWLGLTVACMQCHDHKYDPLTQREYYQLFAFFHNVPENGLDGYSGNAAPMVKAPSAEQRRELAELAANIERAQQRLAGDWPELDAAQIAWEAEATQQAAAVWTVLDAAEFKSAGAAVLTKQEDGSILASGPNPATETYTVTAVVEAPKLTALRLEALTDASLAAQGPGRSANGNVVLTDARLEVRDAAGTILPTRWKAASADFSQQDFPIAQAIDDKPQTGWAIHPQVGQAHAAVFELANPLAAQGPLTLTVALDFQSQYGQHQLGRWRLSMTGSADPHGAQKLPEAVATILNAPAEQRSGEQQATLRQYFREHVAQAARPIVAELTQMRLARTELEGRVPTAMVMREMPQPRETFLLVRGQYDKKGDKVLAGVPASLPPLPADAPTNRLGLAQWLVSPEHPLTARVIVNRYWQMYFGVGLVKTSEDFGSQGEWPSHPELLDWLATEFIQSGWDVKHMQRMLVTSATYRQASAVSRELIARDPENRLLARGSRLRLPAEFIRDQALAVSGLLDGRIGGVSVSPYQPIGIWEELASREDGAKWTAQVYVQSHGPDLYRRTMYTYWKRTSPPPTLSTFDAPDRETCTVRRARTNTPLQALVLMNDPTYVEASRKLAERLLTEAESADERIGLAFRLATARLPKPAELEILRRLVNEQLAVYGQDRAAALKLLAVGESPRDERLDPAELAAWTVISSMILNLDETLTKG